MSFRRLVTVVTALFLTIGAPIAAEAVEEYVGTPPPQVDATELQRGVQVLGTTTTRDPGGLPVTGGDLAALALFGVGAVGIGTVLVRRGRTASVTG